MYLSEHCSKKYDKKLVKQTMKDDLHNEFAFKYNNCTREGKTNRLNGPVRTKFDLSCFVLITSDYFNKTNNNERSSVEQAFVHEKP